jgi:phage FluMu gp28-like protein
MRAIEIAKKVIVDETSQLHFSGIAYGSGEATRYLIENGHLVVKITHGKIRIINGKYKYDVAFRNDDKAFQNVKRLFARSMTHRLDKLESQINSRVEKSLDHILKDLNTEKNGN